MWKTTAYIAVMLTLGCGSEPEEITHVVLEAPPPPVAVSGARAIMKVGDAFLPIFDTERRPRIRLDGPLSEGPLDLEIAFMDAMGGHTPASVEEVRLGGHRWLLTEGLPGTWDGEGFIEIKSGGYAPHYVEVLWQRAPEHLPLLKPVVAARKAGDLEKATEALHVARMASTGLTRLWVEVEAGRVAYRKQDLSGVVKAWEGAAKLALTLGVPTEAASRYRALSFLHLHTNQLRRAHDDIDLALEAGSALPDQGTYRDSQIAGLSYYQGLIALKVGQLRVAREHFERSIESAMRGGVFSHLTSSVSSLLDVFHYTGHFNMILDYVFLLKAPYLQQNMNHYDAMISSMNVGWHLLECMIRGEFPRDYEIIFDNIYDSYTKSISGGYQTVANAANINFEWLNFNFGRTVDTESIEDSIADKSTDKSNVLFSHWMMAEQYLSRGYSDRALTSFEHLAHLSTRIKPLHSDDFMWRSEYGVARALRSMNLLDESIEYYRDAWRSLSSIFVDLEVSGAKSVFISSRDEFVQDYIEALIDNGQLRDAIKVSDDGYAQTLISLRRSQFINTLSGEERSKWLEMKSSIFGAESEINAHLERMELMSSRQRREATRRLTELRAQYKRRFDEAWLWLEDHIPQVVASYDIDHIPGRLPARHAVAFLTRYQGHQSTILIDSDGFRTHMGEPLAQYDHIYVINRSGSEIPRLIAARRHSHIPYLGVLSKGSHDFSAAHLIVSNPSGDLPFSQREGQRLEDSLTALGKRPTRLSGAQAKKPAVLKAIQNARLFHFAGHGVVDPRDPWSTRLLLANEEALTLTDLAVAQPRVRLVVLSGCRTGYRGHLSARERIGLPEAFLISGAETVIATTEDVDDHISLKFIESFYSNGGLEAPGQAFDKTISALERKDPAVASVFQLWGRP